MVLLPWILVVIEALLLSKNILNDVLPFIEEFSNSRMAIVTSSNKGAALFLLNHTGLKHYFQLIITSDDLPESQTQSRAILKGRVSIEFDSI
jgi:beta-phosphoglucomutase-like phosphatase (HAD superfamily)